MARTTKDLEAYLEASGRSFDKADDETYILPPIAEGKPVVAIRVDGAMVTTTVPIGPVPQGDPARVALFLRRLLELNASDLLFCAYGIRGDSVLLSSAHELENLDLNEVQAILGDIDLALARHLKELVALSSATA
jgi:hypothetical protein